MSAPRILVVEDDPFVAADIARCLRHEGHTVCGPVANSAEALKCARRDRPDLVLMDIDLEGRRDGIETARLIREKTGTPVIFLTGITDREVFQRAKACKPLGYLIKPFQHEQLATLVEIGLENARLQRSLAASEHKFRTLAENSPDAILRLDAGARFLHANSAAADLLGLPSETLVGRTCDDLRLPAEHGALWTSVAADTLASEAPLERDATISGPGGPRHFQIRAVAEHRGNAEPASLVATIRDVTVRQNQERQLHEASQRLLYHANNSPLAVLEFDAEGNCLSWNHKAVEFFGARDRGPAPPVRNCLPLIYPEDRGRFEKVHTLLCSGVESSGFVNARFMHINGSVAHGEWYLSSLLDSGGVCRSILCFVNDVSDRVGAEQSLLRANEEQEVIILNRTSMLREINESLHREIATRMELERDLVRISEREHRRLGHDLHDGICQELAGIRFSVDAISRKQPKDSPARGQLDSIATAVQRAIQHTRLLSRGLAPLQLEAGDIASSLTELAATTATLFEIHCRFDCKGRVPALDLDAATNLYRIAQEAIQNAIKHGRAKAIEVELDFTGRDARLTVADNGTGLPAKPAPAAPGDGMGLKIMRHRAELLRGTVTVHAGPAGGVRVQCVFPK
jgi:PAS domain S-box-containing protein